MVASRLHSGHCHLVLPTGSAGIGAGGAPRPAVNEWLMMVLNHGLVMVGEWWINCMLMVSSGQEMVDNL